MGDIKSSRFVKLLIIRNSSLKLVRQNVEGDYLVGWDCRGTLQSRVVPHNITEEDANKLLADKIEKIESVIKETVSTPLTQSMFDSLVSYIHGVGTSKWVSGRVRKEINKWNYCLAAEWIEKDCRVFRGVCSKKVVRRKGESDLFLTAGEFIFNRDAVPTKGRMANNFKFDRSIPKYNKRR